MLPSEMAVVTIGDASITEGDSGTVFLDFTLTRSGDTSSAVSVSYSTANDTATAGSDYTAVTGVVTFGVGETTATISVPVSGDALVEGDENFFLNLNGISDSIGTGPAASFAAKQDFSTVDTQPRGVSVGDLNGDGKPDVAIAITNQDKVSVFLNTTTVGSSTVTFAAKTDFATGNSPFFVKIGDLNGDGRPDLTTANFLGASVSVLLNTTATGASTASFAAKQDLTTQANPYYLSIGDINGDGLPDLAVANQGSRSVSVLLNQTAPGETTPSFSSKFDFTAGYNPDSVTLGDFNGDGKPDFAVSNNYASSISVLLNTTTTGSATPTFTSHQEFTSFNRTFMTEIADLNADGRVDLAVVNRDAGTVSVLINTTPLGASTFSFGSRQDYTVGNSARAVVVQDLNGDGQPDLAVTNAGSNSVSVLLNQTVPGAATSSFATKQDFATGQGPFYLQIADLNGDSRPDLISANISSTTFSVLLNSLASPSTNVDLSDSQDFTSGDAASSVAQADFNGDGKPDLAIPNRTADAVSVLLNHSVPGSAAAEFDSVQDFGADGGVFAVAVGDFNRDGKPDLVMTSDTNNTITVLLNTTVPGSTTVAFAAPLTFSTGAGPRSVTVADLNGDGLPEIIVGNNLTNTVSVLINTTSPGSTTPSFEAKQDFATGNNPTFVSISDLNGDGLVDLVATNGGSDTVSVLLNTTVPGSSTINFAAKQDFATGQLPKSVAIADVNGDGRPDLAVASFTSNVVSVLLNTTAAGAAVPAFSLKQDFSLGAGSNPSSARFGDFNRDGKPDLAVANSNSSTVSLLINSTTPGAASPTFATKQDFSSGNQPTAAIVGDWNGDGKDDIVVANQGSASVSMLLHASALITDRQASGTILTDDLGPSAILDLNGSDGIGGGFVATFVEDLPSVNITDLDATITDAGFSTLVNLRLIISAVPDGANEVLSLAGVAVPLNANSTGTGIVGGTTFQVSYVAGTRTITIVKNGGGVAPLVDFQTLLRGITYNNSSNSPNTSVRTINIIANDSVADSPVVAATVNVVSTNDTPTDITLSSATIAEDQISGSTVGTFTSTDPDTGGTFTYSLVAGAGSADNGSFTLISGVLRTDTALDFETKNSYSIRVRTTDQGSLSFEKQFTISVTNVNEAPTDVILTPASIAEGLSSGTVIGTLDSIDQDAGGSFSYLLVSGAGSADNGSFTLSNGQLQTAASFDFETKGSYAIRIRTTDQSGLIFEKQLTVGVTNVNETPTNISLTPAAIEENSSIGSIVGSLGTTDPDLGDSFVYTLVAGVGSADNSSFSISNGQLQTAINFDFEVKSSYSIRVRTTDFGGETFEKPFTITVTNLNEAPTDINLSVSDINENRAIGTVVGMLTSADQDSGNTFTYSFAAGTGGGDNGSFTLLNGQLRAAASFDFEVKSSYSIRIRSTDQGGQTLEKQFTITVNNVNEAPTNISLSSTTIVENSSIGTIVGAFSTSDPDVGNTFTHALVAGVGGADNASFTISNGELLTATTVDFESKNSYSIRVQVMDQNGLTFERQFTISVTLGNDAPSDVFLSASTITENSLAGTTVGTFSSVDQDSGDTFTYTLVSGVGGGDNASFTVLGNALKAGAVFNFEAQGSYSIRVRSTDQGGLSFEKVFVITVTDVNEPTTDIGLTATTIEENLALGTVIGAFSSVDPDLGGAITYTLVAGLGSLDNSSFSIVNGQLQSAAVFNFEAKSAYFIRVRTTDQLNVTFEKNFTINVINVNEAPTDMGLSPFSILENRPVGTTVGTFSATDADAGDLFTYALVAGAGSVDNSSFTILNGQLQTAAAFNLEVQGSHSIRVRVTDLGGQTFEKPFTITILNVNEAPTDIALSSASVAENLPSGTPVGLFGSTDPDAGGTFTYSLVSGTGSTDNASFVISNGQLQTAASFDFETKNSYSIRVRGTDQGGLSFEKALAISITDGNDAPTDISLTTSSIIENQISGTAVGALNSTDPDFANTFGYALVAGAGSADNSSFAIVNGILRTAASFDFETKNSYSIRIRSTDQGGLSFEKALTVTITDVNEAPTDSVLSANSIVENAPIGTAIGTFSSFDPDFANTFTYSLIDGIGGTDNSSFLIVNGQLQNAISFDFEARSAFSIRVATTDQGGKLFEKQFSVVVTNLNESPSISNIAPQSILEDASTGILTLTIGDPETAPGALVVSASSSNPVLIPNGNLTLSGQGANRGINVVPIANQNGTATITVVVSDGVNSSSTSFLVTVSAVNSAPTITPFLAQTIQEDASSMALAFTIDDLDNAVAGLSVSATSSNTAVIPNENLVFSGTGANRSLVVTPTANLSGTALITVAVSDGTATSSQTFLVTVQPVDDVPMITVTSQPLAYRVSSKSIVPVAGAATISDVDTPTLQFAGSVLRISGQVGKDTLSILKQDGIARKGKKVVTGKTVIGILTGGKKGVPLTITLNSAATHSTVQSLLRSIGYKSVDKVGGNRTIQIQMTNVGGANTNQANRQIQVGP